MENTFLMATESTQKEELDKIASHLREIALPFFQSWIDEIPGQRVLISSNDISCHWIPYTNSIHIILNYEKITDSMRFALSRTLSVAKTKIQNFSFQDLTEAIEKNIFIKGGKYFPHLNYANAKSVPCDLGKYIDSIKRFNLGRNLIAPQQPSAPTSNKNKAGKLTKNKQDQKKVCIEVEKRLPEINEICMNIAKEHFKNAGAPFAHKKGFIVGTPVCCGINMEYSGYLFEVSARISVEYENKYSTTAISRNYSLDNNLLGTFEEVCENVYKIVLTMAKKIVQKFLASAIVCQIDRPELMERLSILAEQKKGNGQCIRVFFPELSSINTSTAFLGCSDTEKIIIADHPLSPAHCFRFSFKDVAPLSLKAFQLGRYKQLPDSPFEFARFAKKASDLYSNRKPKTSFPLPTLTFTMCNDEWRCSFEDNTIDIVDKTHPDDTLKDHLNRLFKHVDEFCAEKERYVELQIKTLNRLNPTEFAILKHIFEQTTGRWDSGTWLTRVNECLGDTLSTSKTDTEHFLYRLCNLYIDHNNRKIPLASYEWAKADHCKFKKYTTDVDWSSRAFKEATPRSFDKDEFVFLKAEKKTELFELLVDNARTNEERWNIMTLLTERMPKKYTVDFVKSDRGRHFFSSLTKEDAVFAQFFIEGLPGCKRLADEIFSKA